MLITRQRPLRHFGPAAIVGLLLCHAALGQRPVAAQSEPDALREVLATGDAIEAFGRIGVSSARLLGLTDAGAGVFSAYLADGRVGIFRADGAGIEALWLSVDEVTRLIQPWSASMSASGRVVALASSNFFHGSAVYELGPEGARRIVAVGDTDAKGAVLCVFPAARINDAGTVAFVAGILPAGGDCATNRASAVMALYVHDGDGLHRLALADGRLPGTNLLGIGSDGSVTFTDGYSLNFSAIYRATRNDTRKLVGDGDAGPSGLPLRYVRDAATSPRGDVVFTATEGDGRGNLYRMIDDKVVRVASAATELAEGRHLEILGDGNGAVPAVSDSGHIVTLAWLTRTGSSGGERALGAVRFSPDGLSRVIAVNGPGELFAAEYSQVAAPLAVNERGEVGLTMWLYGGGDGAVILREQNGTLTRLYGATDEGPGGTVFALDGLQGTKCLAPDGRVATAATALNGNSGLLCRDAYGTHLIAQRGDPAPQGVPFSDFQYGTCTFTTDGDLIFSAATSTPRVYTADDGSEKLVSFYETSVYRAGANGIERVVGEGDLTVDGATLSEFGSGLTYAANAAGDVVLRAQWSRPTDGQRWYGTSFFRSRDGVLESLESPKWPDSSSSAFAAYLRGLTEDGALVLEPTRSGNGANAGSGVHLWRGWRDQCDRCRRGDRCRWRHVWNVSGRARPRLRGVVHRPKLVGDSVAPVSVHTGRCDPASSLLC